MKTMLISLSIAMCACLLATPIMGAERTKANVPAAKPAVVKAETLSGTVLMVDPGRKLLVVKGADGVPFDLHLTSSTRIQSGRQRLTIRDLSQDKQKTVSVRFVPARNGDIASSVDLKG